MGGPVPVQMQEMLCGGRYLSGDQALRVFATGSQLDARDGQPNRITLWDASSFEEAVEVAKGEAQAYASIDPSWELLNFFQVFSLGDRPGSGDEVFSLMGPPGDGVGRSRLPQPAGPD